MRPEFPRRRAIGGCGRWRELLPWFHADARARSEAGRLRAAAMSSAVPSSGAGCCGDTGVMPALRRTTGAAPDNLVWQESWTRLPALPVPNAAAFAACPRATRVSLHRSCSPS